MSLELLTIGTELLLGYTVDTNGAEIGRLLAAAGLTLARRTSVGDREDEIRDAVQDALGRTGRVIVTGGLGPTRDDVTKKVVARLFGAPLQFREDLWQGLVERFARMGRTISDRNRCQAEVPEGAIVLANRWGTAPGLWLEGAPGLVVMLPGVPSEMRNLMQHEVLPRLAPTAGGRVVRSRTLRTTGIPESTLAERLGSIEDAVAPLSLAYLPWVGGVDLRLTAWSLPPEEADQRLVQGAALIRARAADWIYGEEGEDLAAVVLARMRGLGLRLAVAESCTGGALGARLTEIPGSSDVFLGGVIAYHNRIKEALLGVPPALLSEQGAVSEPVARAMAVGVARNLEADVAVAITGIAGPGGGTPEKSVGLVFLAVARGEQVRVTRHHFPGDRGEIRARAAQVALYRLLRTLEGSES